MKHSLHRLNVLLVIISLIFLDPCHAEEFETNTGFNDPTNFAPAPPEPAQQGRKEKGNSANAAAIIGAAVAGAMCAMMMAKAQEMPPGPERDQMMMQAMQQCAQAAQSAANAGQNKDGANQLTDSAVASPELGLPEVAKEAKKDDFKIPELPTKTASNLPDFGEDEPIEDIEIPDVGDIDVPSLDTPGLGDLDFGPGVPGSGTPNPVKTPKLTVDEDGDLNDPSAVNPGSSTLLASGSFADEGPISARELEAIGEDADGRRHKDGKSKVDFGSSASGGSESGDGGMDDLMSAFLGGANSAGAAFGGGGQLISLPGSDTASKSKKPKANIFEYANYRYKKLAHKQNRILTRVFYADRSLASTVNGAIAPQ